MEIVKVAPNLTDDQLRFICFILNAAVMPTSETSEVISFDEAELMRNALFREWSDQSPATTFGKQVAETLLTNSAMARIPFDDNIGSSEPTEVELEVRKAAALIVLDWLPLFAPSYVEHINAQIAEDIAAGGCFPVTVDYSHHFLDVIMDWAENGHVLFPSGCVTHYINNVISPESRAYILKLVPALLVCDLHTELPLTHPATVDICSKESIEKSKELYKEFEVQLLNGSITEAELMQIAKARYTSSKNFIN